MNQSTLSRRLGTIIVNGASRVVSSLSTSIVSLVIIQTQSREVWGSAVQWVLIFDLAFSLISWGSSPYLLLEFSLDPRSISRHWTSSSVARLPLLVIFLGIITLSPITNSLKFTMVIWALARYVYHLYEPLLLYHRNFVFSLTLELTALLVTLVPLFALQSQITGEVVVVLFAAGMIWKAFVTTVWAMWIGQVVKLEAVSRHYASEFLVASSPYLLLTFSAMLQQRMDLYVVAYYLEDKETAVYQVFINWLIFCQFLSTLVLSPFAKNIFRVSESVLRKIERRFILAGLLLAMLSIAGVYLVVRVLYRFDIVPWHYAVGYVYILAAYFYSVRNFELGKQRKQSTVAFYSFATSGINLLLSVYLTPRFGTSGALAAATLSQFFLIGLYHLRRSPYAAG